jgi:hypothetical protein
MHNTGKQSAFDPSLPDCSTLLRSFIPHFHPNAAEQMLGIAGRMTVVYLVDDTLVRDSRRASVAYPRNCQDKPALNCLLPSTWLRMGCMAVHGGFIQGLEDQCDPGFVACMLG